MGLLLILAALVAWFAYDADHATSGSSSAPAQSPGGGAGAVGSYGPSPLDEMSQAIYQKEGGFNSSSLNVRNNNPGNLRNAPGQTGTAGGYATFATFGDGWGDLKQYIANTAAQHPGWTFTDFFTHYLGGNPDTGTPAPSDQGNAQGYAQYVANYLGVAPSATVSSVVGG